MGARSGGVAAAPAMPSSYPERRPEQAEPVLWAPAPSGFLSSMTPEDVQVRPRCLGLVCEFEPVLMSGGACAGSHSPRY